MAREIVERLSRDMIRALNTADVKERVAAQGNDVIGDGPDAFPKFIRAESAKWGRVVKQAGIKLE
jgi:tripartite-type tricarboxylate transporter receptor subunit TctC